MSTWNAPKSYLATSEQFPVAPCTSSHNDFKNGPQFSMSTMPQLSVPESVRRIWASHGFRFQERKSGRVAIRLLRVSQFRPDILQWRLSSDQGILVPIAETCIRTAASWRASITGSDRNGLRIR